MQVSITLSNNRQEYEITDSNGSFLHAEYMLSKAIAWARKAGYVVTDIIDY